MRTFVGVAANTATANPALLKAVDQHKRIFYTALPEADAQTECKGHST